MLLTFNDLLNKAGINPDDVNIARHTPIERQLRNIMPVLASERPELFNYYQSNQSQLRERSLIKRKFLASFLGNDDGSTIFVGLYEKQGFRNMTQTEFSTDIRGAELIKFGCWIFPEPSRLYFEYQSVPLFESYKGRLFIDWPKGTRSFIQVAGNRQYPINSIYETNQLISKADKWYEINRSLIELQAMPREWRNIMNQWRGVYLITDISDGARYVGSASGEENIWQRWTDYAESGHGENKLLRKRNPDNFRFCILELTAPSASRKMVTDREQNWKRRLLTSGKKYHFGLNNN